MKTKIKAYGVCIYKIEQESIKILLCKSITSKNKWGFLKGVQEKNESNKQTAKREFIEESSINININLFEDYFEQVNKDKDIGIYLVNANKVNNLDTYFHNNILYSNYLSLENSKVKFFNITQLPIIKQKQIHLISDIIYFLKNKNQSH